MAEKVMITQEQEAAIRDGRVMGKTNQQILGSHTCGHAPKVLQEMSFDKLAAALYVGYEIQPEPAEVLAMVLADLKDMKGFVDERVGYFAGKRDDWHAGKHGSYERVQIRLNTILKKAGEM